MTSGEHLVNALVDQERGARPMYSSHRFVTAWEVEYARFDLLGISQAKSLEEHAKACGAPPIGFVWQHLQTVSNDPRGMRIETKTYQRSISELPEQTPAQQP